MTEVDISRKRKLLHEFDIRFRCYQEEHLLEDSTLRYQSSECWFGDLFVEESDDLCNEIGKFISNVKLRQPFKQILDGCEMRVFQSNNKYKLGFVFGKCPLFTCIKDSHFLEKITAPRTHKVFFMIYCMFLLFLLHTNHSS